MAEDMFSRANPGGSFLCDEEGRIVLHWPAPDAEACVPDCRQCEAGIPVRRLKRVIIDGEARLVDDV